MRLTALGHQGWAIETPGHCLLVDPVLGDWFGTTARQRFRIWPPRKVLLERMPPIDAVVVTNEHLDHFNLRSLRLLPPATPLYFGDLTPACCIAAARRAGFAVTLLADRQPVTLGGLVVRLYLCAPESAPWERRVYHAVVESTVTRRSVVIQSDGLLAPDLIDDLASGTIMPMSMFIATNNAQIVPAGGAGAYDNLLPIDDVDRAPIGIRVFHEVLCAVSDALGYAPHLSFCGGGYMQAPAKHGPFLFCDAAALEQHLSALSLEQQVHCFSPGEGCTMELDDVGIAFARHRCDWIECEPAIPEPVVEDWFAHSIFPDFATPAARTEAIACIEEELRRMAPCLLHSDLGRSVTAANAYLDGPTGPHRFVFRFYGDAAGHIASAALDINRCRFEWLDSPEEAVIMSIPFGVDVHLVDFHALLGGGLQIWELATARMRQWHLGRDRRRSPVAFLYAYFSEQVRPELAAKMYARIAQEHAGAGADGDGFARLPRRP